MAVLIFGKLADVLNRRKLIVGLSAFSMAVGLVVPLIMPTWNGMIIYAVINGASLGVYVAVDIALMSLVLPHPEDASRDLGILASATSGTAALSPLIAAVLIAPSTPTPPSSGTASSAQPSVALPSCRPGRSMTITPVHAQPPPGHTPEAQ